MMLALLRQSYRRWRHRLLHGEPMIRLGAAHTLEHVCVCGEVISMSHYPPSEELMKRLDQDRARLLKIKRAAAKRRAERRVVKWSA